MKFQIALFLILLSPITRAQNESATFDLTGEWGFEEAIQDTSFCEAPAEFPIEKFQFVHDKFTFTSFAGDTASGDYEVMEGSILRFYNAVVNGIPIDRDQRIELKSVNHSGLVLLVPFECGRLRVVYRKLD